ncbi:MAG TPA: zinc-dependent metalloprotease family protein [Herpetosiphonaceae bacterium]
MGRRIMMGGRLVLVAALIALLSLSYGTGAGLAARSNASMWRDIAEADLGAGAARQIIPQRYRTLALDTAALRARLAQAPLEMTGNRAAELLLPLPDGTFGRFAVVDSPMMEPGLAVKFPELKTYSAQGIDDPSASARLDWTSAGFHAMILSDQGNVFIDPYRPGDTTSYISYYTRDYLPSLADIEARAKELQAESEYAPDAAKVHGERSAVGATLRTYRLAMAATGEYTAFHGGTVTGAMAAIVTSMNRVNAVYEREVAVRMVLVANNNLIVYTNAQTDPYTNDDGFEMLGENQANLTSVIGGANYDIGHVFSTGGGGVASLGCVCRASDKAEGVTGSPQPIGDPFDIDYVAHEIGHQFGADHSFNGTTQACGGGNRAGSNAWEPGSGSTIMAYAGICGAEDLQRNSDPYFHTGSFSEIIAFTEGSGNACAVRSDTGNLPPVVDAGDDVTIPARTPFTLTGSATDPGGQTLSYAWEQFDAGTAAPPNTDNGSRAIFRSFNPVAGPSRTFPKLSDILGNVSTFGESLPTTTREMTFRLTARDNVAGGGGVAFDTMSVNVISTAGPFLVTAPNTAVTWTGNSQQTVTWDVANTTLPPVSCANVTILLSTDGGQTFGQTLLASTANDGSQAVTVPNISSTTARVKVQCATSVFFDISNTNFTITPGAATQYVYLPLLAK